MTFPVKELIANQQRAIALLRMSDNRYLGARDEELAEISNFLDGCIARKHGGSMFVFGMSGTGKTTTVEHALAACKSRHPRVATVAMSGSSFDSYRDLATELVDKLMDGNFRKFSNIVTQRKLDYRRLCILMTSLFQQCKFTICLIDEVDYLQSLVKYSRASCTKSNWMLQALFMAANGAKSNVVLIAVSNHIELATRIAAKQCRKMLFRPYTSDQICRVMTAKLSQLGDGVIDTILSKTGLLVLARRVANTAGDLRACLDAFARAIADSSVALEKRLASIESLSTQASLDDLDTAFSSDDSFVAIDPLESTVDDFEASRAIDLQDHTAVKDSLVTSTSIVNASTTATTPTSTVKDDTNIDLLEYRVDHRDITRATPTLSLDRRELLKVHLEAMPTLELLVLLAACRACICQASHSVALSTLKMPLLALAETLGMDINVVVDFYCEKLHDAVDVFCQVGLLSRDESALLYHQVDDEDNDTFDSMHIGYDEGVKENVNASRNGTSSKHKITCYKSSDETSSQSCNLTNKCAAAGVTFKSDPREIANLVLEAAPVVADLSIKDDIETPWPLNKTFLATGRHLIAKEKHFKRLSWVKRR